MAQEIVARKVPEGKAVSLPGPRPERRIPIARLGFTVLLHLCLLVGAVIMAAPFVWMILTSLKDNTQAFRIPPTWLPNPVFWDNYPQSLQAESFGQAYLNSGYITIIVVASVLLTSSMAGYSFARIRFPGRNVLFILFLATLMVPFQLTIIPLFLIMRDLGWIDTHLSLIVPASLFSAVGVFLMRQFMLGIPLELEEAAIVDGAGRWTLFWRIIFPLLKAPLAALGIFTFIGQWNSFFYPLIFLSSPNLFTVPMLLSQFRSEFSTQWTLVMAGSVIAVVPILIVYVLLQKQIIEGIATTGLKA